MNIIAIIKNSVRPGVGQTVHVCGSHTYRVITHENNASKLNLCAESLLVKACRTADASGACVYAGIRNVVCV